MRLPIVVLMLLALTLAFAQRVGETASGFSLVDAEGALVRLADFRGTPVVVNFWATWCFPCLEEIPLFQAASDSLNKEAPAVVFLLVNGNEQPDVARRYLEKEGITLTAALEATAEERTRYRDIDTTLKVMRDYRVRGMPSTFFIDADGVIQAITLGLVTPAELSALLAQVGVSWKP